MTGNCFRTADPFGNSSEARQAAGSAIQLSPRSRYDRGVAALALARAGENEQAQKMAAELARQFPQDTFLNSYWLPMVHASIELNRRNPNRALELLRVAQAYEMGAPTPYIVPLGAWRYTIGQLRQDKDGRRVARV